MGQSDGVRDRQSGSEVGELSASEVLPFLTPRLRATLASLWGAPESVAEATVQLLPFGSRAALEALSPPLAVCGRPVDEFGRRSLSLTPFAYEVMAAAAEAEAADPAGSPDWDEQFEAAARAVLDQRPGYRRPPR
jgi:hypothetical protein